MQVKEKGIPIETPGWNYEIYREYLWAVCKSKDCLLPIAEYPSQFVLSKRWHRAFDLIRTDPLERWGLIGYQDGQRRLIVSRIAATGLMGSVPGDVMSATINRARLKTGISDLAGDFHSHPRNPTSETQGAFSLGDLYGLLHCLSKQRPSDPPEFFRFVVDGNNNLAVFGTRGSLKIVLDNLQDNYEDFAKYWYKRFSWNFKGFSPTEGELAEPVSRDAPSVWTINRAVAHQYQLALYRGLKDKPLVRNYPGQALKIR